MFDKFIFLLNDALSILGKKWTIEILFHLMRGNKRYSELLDLIDDISEKMLTERLRELQELGLVTKIVVNINPNKSHYVVSERCETINQLFYELSLFSIYKMDTDGSASRGYALARIKNELREMYLP